MTLHERIAPPKIDPAVTVSLVTRTVNDVIAEAGDSRAKERFDRLTNGETLAQILGITRDELEALYQHGYSLLIQQKYPLAQEVFQKLVDLDPVEPKYRYCFGLVFQAQGDIDMAARNYAHFLVLDATNFDGYLRMGECHLACKEPEMALECFTLARAEAVKQPGVPGAKTAIELADAQIKSLQETV